MIEASVELPNNLRRLPGPLREAGPVGRLVAGLVAVALLAGLAGGGLAGWRWWQQHRLEVAREQAREQSTAAATAFLDAWQEARWGELSATVAGGSGEPADRIRSAMRRLEVERVRLEPGAVRLVDRDRPDAGARVGYTARLTLRGLGDWRYSGTLSTLPAEQASRRGGEEADRWVVEWSAAALHPALEDGQRLERRVSWPQRAPILGADGRPLDPGDTQLRRIVGDLEQIGRRRARELGPLYRPGDTVGTSGLQRLYEQRLAGAPSGDVYVAGNGGGVDEVLKSFSGRRPRPVTTGLDVSVQRAAEDALAGAPGPAAMVVLDPASKAIRAVVNDPAGFDRALAGQYAPGSTFKVVTTLALLRAGIDPSTTTRCPPAVDIGGREFTNYQGAAYGTIPFARAFFLSCNTVFVREAAQLPDGALMEAARTMGFNLEWTLGIADPYNSFPEPQDAAETAAAAFGQARVTASPVQMAAVAAGVASGAWDNPWLAAPQRGQVTANDLGGAAGVITELMQEVPRRGTAEGAGLPDGIAGKTGTAEVQRGGGIVNDTWFIGFDPRPSGTGLAWAVLVENGRSGGSTAAPVVAEFLAALGRD